MTPEEQSEILRLQQELAVANQRADDTDFYYRKAHSEVRVYQGVFFVVLASAAVAAIMAIVGW